MARKTEPSERTCIVTRETLPVDDLIRFVIAPDETVVADIRRRLPGRGVWVTATREAVETAELKRLFARGFKAQVTVAPGLAERVEALLEQDALAALSMARKAGLVLTGFGKVEAAIGSAAIAGVIHASDGSEDGVRKLTAALMRRFGQPDAVPVSRNYRSEQLDLAIGRANVIHAALLAGGASDGFVTRDRFLRRYRAGVGRNDDNGRGTAAPREMKTV
ncbi:MAG: DNA-binding protein [Hyphomicrobiales bacterium]|nr:MAG: DNA-binding protein [Hyphomicrobiales bacterium]